MKTEANLHARLRENQKLQQQSRHQKIQEIDGRRETKKGHPALMLARKKAMVDWGKYPSNGFLSGTKKHCHTRVWVWTTKVIHSEGSTEQK